MARLELVAAALHEIDEGIFQRGVDTARVQREAGDVPSEAAFRSSASSCPLTCSVLPNCTQHRARRLRSASARPGPLSPLIAR